VRDMGLVSIYLVRDMGLGSIYSSSHFVTIRKSLAFFSVKLLHVLD